MAEGGLPFKKHAAKSRKASTKILKDLVTKMQAEAPPLHAIRWPPRGKRPGTVQAKTSTTPWLVTLINSTTILRVFVRIVGTFIVSYRT
jgi:hypothetical protein